MIDSAQLRALQAPLKKKYQEQPEAACQTLVATGVFVPDQLACEVETHSGSAVVGLHPATGGSGNEACSANMLLEALVGCAGVTLRAVSTALSVPLSTARITAEGDLDFRGTLGVDRTAPIGLTKVRLKFEIPDQLEAEQLDKLISLTERYCVVLQTLTAAIPVETSAQAGDSNQ